MSTIESSGIQSVLAQMRAAAQTGILPPAQTATAAPVQGAQETQSFGEVIAQSLDSVSATQARAGKLAEAFEMGDPNVALPRVMVALEQASVSFEAVKQVRNRMVAAYQEIMNMQV